MPRILIIDNKKTYRELLRTYITAVYDDIDIIDYDPNKNGLPDNTFHWKDYDLILLNHDLGLANINGIKWMTYYNRIAEIPPVIMITSIDDPDISVKALNAGAIDFIDKNDISAESLKASIDEVLSLNEKQNHHHTTKYDVQIKKFGIMIPGYTILEEIAHGGMSTLFLAQPFDKNNKIVLKVIYTEGHKDPLALKRFMQEYNLISHLNHPNIIQIYERGFASNFAYIAMEYFSSGDLNKRINTALKTEIALDYLRQMCLGLIALHKIKVIHCDIKPANILFRDDNTLTITDFGVAKSLTEAYEDITIDNQILGTPYYMSPEQASGMPVDHRSDLYSLGIVFYQMLTKKYPYTARSIAELISAHLYQPIPKLPVHLSKYQPIINGLLEKDPDDRFQSAHDLLLGINWNQ